MQSLAKERIGKYEMAVALRPAPPESQARQDHRVNALMMWLLKEYESHPLEQKNVDCFSRN
jgi:hypothetical protein